jgi:hypothetical protein
VDGPVLLLDVDEGLQPSEASLSPENAEEAAALAEELMKEADAEPGGGHAMLGSPSLADTLRAMQRAVSNVGVRQPLNLTSEASTDNAAAEKPQVISGGVSVTAASEPTSASGEDLSEPARCDKALPDENKQLQRSESSDSQSDSDSSTILPPAVESPSSSPSSSPPSLFTSPGPEYDECISKARMVLEELKVRIFKYDAAFSYFFITH